MQSLETMFMADVAYVADHPSVLHLLSSVLGRANHSSLRLMIKALIQRYERRLSGVIEEARQCGEICPTLDREMVATPFCAIIQHLIFQALISGEIASLRDGAHGGFISYRVCVEATS
jgi:hypothetical protein